MSASTEKKLRQAAREAGTDKKIVAQQKEAAEKAKSKRKWTLGTVLVFVLIAAILILNSNLLYTRTTALTVGDTKYSPARVSYHYANQYYTWANQYGSYASLFGLDTSNGLGGLSAQECSMTDGGTWADYFMDLAIAELEQNKALTDYAEAQGITLTEEELAEAEASLGDIDTFAKSQGYASGDNLLSANYGSGVTVKLALEEVDDYALASKAVTTFSDSLVYTPEELEEKYQSYNGDNDYFDIVYYPIDAETVEAEDGTAAATEETMAEAKAKAEAVMAAYLEAENEDVEVRLNEALAAAGIDGSASHSSAVTGASLPEYKDWALDAERETGDVTVAESSDLGRYYVAAFVSRDDNHYKLANVRHILVKAEADESGAYTDEAKAAAKARAEEILAQWESGEATEESFAQLANELSEDEGSNTNGGLYEDIMRGQMVSEFDEFCFAGHEYGDTAIVYGESSSYAGYHVMFYVGEGDLASNYIAESELVNEASQQWLEELTAPYEAVKGFWFRLVG